MSISELRKLAGDPSFVGVNNLDRGVEGAVADVPIPLGAAEAVWAVMVLVELLLTIPPAPDTAFRALFRIARSRIESDEREAGNEG